MIVYSVVVLIVHGIEISWKQLWELTADITIIERERNER